MKELTSFEEITHYQIARHIAPWFKHEIAKHLSIMNKDHAIRLLQNKITNDIGGGSYQISSGPHKKITLKEWRNIVDSLVFEEAVKQGYWILRNEYVPKDKENLLCDFTRTILETIKEVYKEDWVLEFQEGGMFSEWIEMKKGVFKRTFWKLWKRYQREEQPTSVKLKKYKH